MQSKCRSISRFTLLILAMIILFCFELNAQEEKKKGFIARRDSTKEANIAAGKGFLSFLGGPGYTPELKLLIAVGALYSF
ncbi:MAG: hypothetical protein KAQ62_26950, partial [Cyclobacteriaceae bacterium]|nr:hypothetical protein [Cyclobacteriaceae bacterium]